MISRSEPPYLFLSPKDGNIVTVGSITGVGLTTTGAIDATGQTIASGAITSTGVVTGVGLITTGVTLANLNTAGTVTDIPISVTGKDSSSATQLLINVGGIPTGNFIDLQIAGTSKASIDTEPGSEKYDVSGRYDVHYGRRWTLKCRVQ
jgi:hypothetical protein